ncbi:MAG: glutamate racemase [Candidatus Hydrogenedentes bacterium]|nr:glutamate racemase [Candidatus Hydrogenedentota bacterium]
MAAPDRPAIGIFDSGVGGLTVVRQIAERLPAERIVYLGDTARVPYGTKSAETVIRYARACASVLLKRGIKMLVVACNTASAHALAALRDELAIPVLGVIEPGAHQAVQTTKSGRIGVIGTSGTISSGAYQNAIHALNSAAQVFVQPCPLFVPLVEEGWTEGPIPKQIASAYLAGLLEHNIDTLVLGCTHYPLLKNVIGEVAGPRVTLVDSAESVADVVAETLQCMGATAEGLSSGNTFLVSDAPESFDRVGGRFLGRGIDKVEWVDF